MNGLRSWERVTATQIQAGVDALMDCFENYPDKSLSDWVEHIIVAALKAGDRTP